MSAANPRTAIDVPPDHPAQLPRVRRHTPHQAGEQPSRPPDLTLLRLPQVLALIPIARSTWWKGVKEGRFPAPVMIGPRTAAWRLSDIKALVDGFGSAAANGR